ncbi:hypothetical protein DB771_09915 [Burkholderia sp. AU29985]|nr:hypothetical protein XM57_26615 [Burkholderia cepacia]AYZ95184.1 hypothetical protein EGY28_09190 [Burkholderia dolosa]ETP63753.1 hypothetical protein BDSB_20750 [Burkholderia dolosa PC543]PRE47031.1 hypothetical protein C6P87_18990 [Burkholderia sp. AU12872]PUA76986.1 hypothetical protein DB771_09915 [Burkholderia sp. AU29985]
MSSSRTASRIYHRPALTVAAQIRTPTTSAQQRDRCTNRRQKNLDRRPLLRRILLTFIDSPVGIALQSTGWNFFGSHPFASVTFE